MVISIAVIEALCLLPCGSKHGASMSDESMYRDRVTLVN